MKPTLANQHTRDQAYYDQAALYISSLLFYSTYQHLLNSRTENEKTGLSDYYEARCMKCLYLITLITQPDNTKT